MYFNGNLFKCRQRNRNFSSMFSLCFGCSAIWRIVTSHYYCQDVNWFREPVNKDSVVTNQFISSVIAIRSCICNQVNLYTHCTLDTFVNFLFTTIENGRLCHFRWAQQMRNGEWIILFWLKKSEGYVIMLIYLIQNILMWLNIPKKICFMKNLMGWILNVGLT